MILRKLYLYLDPENFRTDADVLFGFRTRYLCSFIERMIAKKKLQTEGYSKICVMGTKEGNGTCSIVAENSLRIPLYFDQRQYDESDSNDRHEFFIKMLLDGIEKAATSFPIPTSDITDAIQAFRNGGYNNCWTHDVKNDKSTGIKVSLVCHLEQEIFNLHLVVELAGHLISDHVILSTKPDEIIFKYRFKRLEIKSGIISVYDKFDSALYSIPLRDVLAVHKCV